jgi:AbrB family looped-hinge helix DNA binding protein
MKTTIDKTGRVVIPKSIRDRRNLVPGTEVEIIETDEGIELILPDDRVDAILVEKDGHLVVSAETGVTTTMEETLALRDQLREPRFY